MWCSPMKANVIVVVSLGAVSKQERVKLFFLKGKVYDILPEYSRQAEDALTKSVIQAY